MFCSSMFQSDVSPKIKPPYCCWNLWAIWLGMALGTRPWKPAIVATNAATIGRYQCSSWVTVNVSNASILSQETSTLSSYAWVLGRPSTKCCGYLKISEIWKSLKIWKSWICESWIGDIRRHLPENYGPWLRHPSLWPAPKVEHA